MIQVQCSDSKRIRVVERIDPVLTAGGQEVEVLQPPLPAALVTCFPMIILLKSFIVLFLAAWSWFGLWMVLSYDRFFGFHPDDPAESSGARSLNVTQVSIVWVGVFGMALYFLIN